MREGAGGLAAVSAGISEPLLVVVGVLLFIAVCVYGWKILKLVWAAFSQ